MKRTSSVNPMVIPALVAMLLTPVLATAAGDQPSPELKAYAAAVGKALLAPRLIENPDHVFAGLRSATDLLGNQILQDFDDASTVRNQLESNVLIFIEAIERHAMHGLTGEKQASVLERSTQLRQALYRYIVAYRGMKGLKTVEERKAAFSTIKQLAEGYRNALAALRKAFDGSR